MKKRYARKQILEALHWWRAQLKRLNEAGELDDFDTQVQSDELGGEDGSEPDYSEYEAAVRRQAEKDKENLEAERKQLGLGPDEVVCLVMGSLCIYNGKTHETRGLTKEQYDKYCELSKKWHADWEENVGKHWPKKIKESLGKKSAMGKNYTKKQIQETIAHWKGVLESMKDEDAGRKQDLDAFADMVYSFIKNAVDKGMWAPEYDGEEVSRENI